MVTSFFSAVDVGGSGAELVWLPMAAFAILAAIIAIIRVTRVRSQIPPHVDDVPVWWDTR